MQDPHKAHIVRPDVVVSGVLVNRGLKGIAVRIYNNYLHIWGDRWSVSQSVSQSLPIKDIDVKGGCSLGRWPDDEGSAGDWEKKPLLARCARY